MAQQLSFFSVQSNLTSLTMSSREIAELVGKRHNDILRDIRVMLDGLDTERKFALSEYIDKTGRKLPEYQLPKRETLILVSGYNVKLRARIIDRWQELEEAMVAPSVPFITPANIIKTCKPELKKLIKAEVDKRMRNGLYAKKANRPTSQARLYNQTNNIMVLKAEAKAFITHIMNSHVYWIEDNGQVENMVDIEHLVHIVTNSNKDFPNGERQRAAAALAVYGLRVQHNGVNGPELEISTTATTMRSFLKNTRWEFEKYRNLLKALPEAHTGYGNRYFTSGVNTPYVSVPIESLAQIGAVYN